MKFYLFLPGQWWDREKPVSQIYDEMIEQAVYAEELGFDGLWLAEQNLVSFLAAPDPLQLAAIIASRTKRIRIGVGIFVLPFHHPLRLAGQIAQIDQLSGGRFDVGAGRGASPHQMRQFQAELPPEDSRAYFAEHLEIMVKQWADSGADAFDGRFFQYQNATVLPTVAQHPHPPLWVGSSSPESSQWGVKMGLDTNVLFTAFRKPFSYVESVYAGFEQAVEEAGRERSSVQFAVNRMTFVGQDEDEARAMLRYVVMNQRVIDQQVGDLEKVKGGDYVVDRPVREDEPDVQEMYDNIAYGDEAVVREKIRAYAELGVDQYSAWFNVGQDHDRVMWSMKTFAEKIMPEFHVKERLAVPKGDSL